MTTAEWLQLLLELLCKLYKKWGGKCEDLATDPADRAKQLDTHNETNGPPPVAEHEDTLKILDDLELHLANPANSLDPDTNNLLAELIAGLRDDI